MPPVGVVISPIGILVTCTSIPSASELIGIFYIGALLGYCPSLGWSWRRASGASLVDGHRVPVVGATASAGTTPAPASAPAPVVAGVGGGRNLSGS